METTRNDGHTSEEVDECSDDEFDEVALFYGCRKFSEVRDPIAAMRWITQMDDFFEVMKYADEDKVTYAASMLKSEARVWWDMVKDTSESETPTKMTWSRFKKMFKDEFHPMRVEVELMQEFRTLKQERLDMDSFREYTNRFNELWWFFADYLTYEKRMIYFYVGGLTDEIKDLMSESDITTLQNAIAASRIIHEEINIRRLEERNDLKRKRRGRRMCSSCRKRHGGECRFGSKECYKCGKLGHFARECPSD